MPESLKVFWKFDDADLAANRNGQLSEKQKTHLLEEHKSQQKVFLRVGGVVALIVLCMPVLLIGARAVIPAILSGNFQAQDIPPAGMGSRTVLSIVLPLLLLIGIYLLRAGKQPEFRVNRAGGRVTYTWGTKRVRNYGNSARPYDDVRVLYLSLGEKKFEVPEGLKEILREGEEWTIHYTSNPFKFLSGEKA